MSRMTIIITEGDTAETVFDEIIEGWMAPPKPDQIPAAIRNQLDPNAKPPPWLKAFLIAAIGNAIHNGALKDPRLQPLTTQLTKRPTGWTISVDMPAPDQHGDIQIVDP